MNYNENDEGKHFLKMTQEEFEDHWRKITKASEDSTRRILRAGSVLLWIGWTYTILWLAVVLKAWLL